MILAKFNPILICFLISLASSFSGFAGVPIEFEHINRSNGLPSNSVTSIVQDKYGMMWFGTYNGLVRFNGYDYTIFTHNASDTNSLSDNLINCLRLTQDGRILVGHENHGFSIFNYETETFQRYVHYRRKINSLHNDRVFELVCDQNGIVWIGTINGLGSFDTKTGNFKKYDVLQKEQIESEENLISSILTEPEGTLLLFVGNRQVIRFNPKTNTSTPLPQQRVFSQHLRINRGGLIFKDSYGFLWIGTEYDGIVRFDESTGKSICYNKANSAMTSNVILHITEDSRGKVWVATDGSGLMEFDHFTEKFTFHRYNFEEPNSLSSNAVYYAYEDNTKHLWIGTYAAGLNIIKNNKKRFELYSNAKNDNRHLSYKSILSFEKADNDKIWIGTDGGGLNLFDPNTKTFEYFNIQNSSICSNIAKSMARDNEGNIWMGTYGNGLCKANFKKKEFTQFLPSKTLTSNTIGRINVWAIDKGQNGDLWMGVLDGGLDRYNSKTKKFDHYFFQNEKEGNTENGSVVAVFCDSKNRIWVGTETQGIRLFHPNTHETIVFKNEPNKRNSLISNNIQCIFEDNEGSIWVGTKQGGISKLLNEKDKTFLNFDKSNGFPGNVGFAIMEDGQNNLWVSTDNGLCRFNKTDNSFRVFDKSDGLQSLEFAMKACLKDKNGFFYFGGTDGFNRFHPDSISYNQHVPLVYISNLKLFNKTVDHKIANNHKVYFDKPIHLLDTLVLDFSENVFAFEFTAIDYTCPERNKFAYRLEGFETNWNYVDASKRIATYTNLSPGIYNFHVKASNNDGLWNEMGRTITVIVSPPWWQTWWFRSAVVFFITFSLIAFYYMRMNQIKERNMILYKLVKIKTSELEDKNEELNQSNITKDKLFSIIGHDLRNPVAALAALSDMLYRNYKVLEDKDRQKIMNHIQTSSTTLKILVNNLLDWAMVQSRHLNPQPSIVEIKKITEECFDLLELHAEGKGIILKNTCTKGHYVFADQNMLQTILRNLISNAIKFTSKGGQISVETVQSGNELQIIISDNGAGMNQEKINQLLGHQKVISTTGTSNEKGSGLGLEIVKEFMQVNKGRIQIESEQNKGSKFIIILPVTG